MTERVRIPGGRDVVASLDAPEERLEGGDRPVTETCVIACPPHPEHGGSRTDRRLRSVADALVAREIACLRFDYGERSEGIGERTDARRALEWTSERYDRVGVFGYSFGGAIAILSAAGRSDVCGVSVLAPVAGLSGDLDVVAALAAVDCPVQVIVGERDETTDREPIVDRARELEYAVESMTADHRFVGQQDRIGNRVAEFLSDAC